MKFSSAISEIQETPGAVDALIRQIRAQLNRVDLAAVFFTAHHRERAGILVQALRDELQCKTLVGCSAEGVIGADREVERRPGIALLTCQFESVRAHPFHIATDQWRALLMTPDDLREKLGLGEDARAIIGFGDPWTTPLNQFTQALDMLAPRSPLIGGMASAARAAGQNVLVCNDDTFNEGIVGVSLSGAIEVQTVVSQGARPIGEKFVITRGRDNIIEQLGGKPAMHVLQEMFQALPERDQTLMQHGLLIGRAISEYRESFGRGDFLVRNITGADEQTGAIALTDHIRIGQTVQFHVRDADSADEDLRLLLQSAGPPGAALLFSCNGRGTNMFDAPDHDIAVTNELMPKIPVAGFFAAGEFGPVGGRNFVHGHTASFAMLRPG